MLKKIFIFIFYFISFSSLNAEVVKKISIEGNNRISEETIKVYGEIEINKNYSEIDLNKITNNLYSTEFFENVNLNIKNNILQIKVKEYPVINQLIIVGEKRKSYEAEIKKLIKLKEKNLLIKPT